MAPRKGTPPAVKATRRKRKIRKSLFTAASLTAGILLVKDIVSLLRPLK